MNSQWKIQLREFLEEKIFVRDIEERVPTPIDTEYRKIYLRARFPRHRAYKLITKVDNMLDCSSDALSHSEKMSKELRLQCLKNLTDLLSRTFTGQFVFPALGHEDIGLSFKETAELWMHWLPTEALQTFEKSEYRRMS